MSVHGVGCVTSGIGPGSTVILTRVGQLLKVNEITHTLYKSGYQPSSVTGRHHHQPVLR